MIIDHKKINPKQWCQFRKRSAKANPFIMDLIYYYLTTDVFTKIYNTKPVEDIGIFEGYQHMDNVPFKIFDGFGKSILIKVNNPNFTKSLVNKSKFYARIMVNKLKLTDLSRLSDEKLYNLYSELVTLYRKFALYSIPLWLFGEKTLSSEIKKILKKKSVNQFNEIYITLITPTIPSFAFKEELEILKIAKEKHFSNKKLQKLVDNYGFMIYDYQGPESKETSDYIKEIKTITKKNNIKDEFKKKKKYYKELKYKQNKIITKLRLNNKEKNIIKALQHGALLQDLRKYHNSHFNFKTEILFKEMAKRLKIKYNLIRYILPHEMKIIWKKKKLNKDIEERTKHCVFTMKNGKSRVYTGKAMRPFLSLRETDIVEKDELKGEIASLGKVSGGVCIVKSAKEVKKIKKGEILVAPMTTPDFMLAIKKCAAIVTDEGGITCHAAIVAREMNKPCIIGTKIATKVLKDGELVEVDANKGIVKKIK